MGRDPAEQKALDPFPTADRFSVAGPGEDRKHTATVRAPQEPP